jgi:hypothetical protein
LGVRHASNRARDCSDGNVGRHDLAADQPTSTLTVAHTAGDGNNATLKHDSVAFNKIDKILRRLWLADRHVREGNSACPEHE